MVLYMYSFCKLIVSHQPFFQVSSMGQYFQLFLWAKSFPMQWYLINGETCVFTTSVARGISCLVVKEWFPDLEIFCDQDEKLFNLAKFHQNSRGWVKWPGSTDMEWPRWYTSSFQVEAACITSQCEVKCCYRILLKVGNFESKYRNTLDGLRTVPREFSLGRLYVCARGLDILKFDKLNWFIVFHT